jgi:hypothetical protein
MTLRTARAISIAGMVMATLPLAAWFTIRLSMGVEARMPAPWQVYRFSVVTLLLVPMAVLALFAAKPIRPSSALDVPAAYLMLPVLAFVWLVVAVGAAAISGI